MDIIQRYNELPEPAKAKVLNKYFKRLGKSIKVDFSGFVSLNPEKVVHCFKTRKGWGEARGSTGWNLRVSYWDKTDTYWILDSGKMTRTFTRTAIPVFQSWFKAALADQINAPNTSIYETDTPNTSICATDIKKYTISSSGTAFKTEEPKMKQLMNKMLDTNKEAVQIGAKLSTGKAANKLILGKLFGKFPWYAKLFGKKTDLTENAIAKLAAANVAKALAVQFSKNNEKLEYVTDSMVQDAMVDLTRDSKVLDQILNELETLVDNDLVATITEAK